MTVGFRAQCEKNIESKNKSVAKAPRGGHHRTLLELCILWLEREGREGVNVEQEAHVAPIEDAVIANHRQCYGVAGGRIGKCMGARVSA